MRNHPQSTCTPSLHPHVTNVSSVDVQEGKVRVFEDPQTLIGTSDPATPASFVFVFIRLYCNLATPSSPFSFLPPNPPTHPFLALFPIHCLFYSLIDVTCVQVYTHIFLSTETSLLSLCVVTHMYAFRTGHLALVTQSVCSSLGKSVSSTLGIS